MDEQFASRWEEGERTNERAHRSALRHFVLMSTDGRTEERLLTLLGYLAFGRTQELPARAVADLRGRGGKETDVFRSRVDSTDSVSCRFDRGTQNNSVATKQQTDRSIERPTNPLKRVKK